VAKGARRLRLALGVFVYRANLLSLSIDYRDTVMYGEHVLGRHRRARVRADHTDEETLRAPPCCWNEWERLPLTYTPSGPATCFISIPDAKGNGREDVAAAKGRREDNEVRGK